MILSIVFLSTSGNIITLDLCTSEWVVDMYSLGWGLLLSIRHGEDLFLLSLLINK